MSSPQVDRTKVAHCIAPWQTFPGKLWEEDSYPCSAFEQPSVRFLSARLANCKYPSHCRCEVRRGLYRDQ